MAIDDVKINTDAYLSDLSGRVSRIEAGLAAVVEKHYQFDKELSGVKIDLKYIREGTDQTKGGIQKLLYGIAAVFITYVGGFILSGGLAPVGQ